MGCDRGQEFVEHTVGTSRPKDLSTLPTVSLLTSLLKCCAQLSHRRLHLLKSDDMSMGSTVARLQAVKFMLCKIRCTSFFTMVKTQSLSEGTMFSCCFLRHKNAMRTYAGRLLYLILDNRVLAATTELITVRETSLVNASISASVMERSWWSFA